MKALRLLRWSGSVLSPRTRPYPHHLLNISYSRLQSTAAAPIDHFDDTERPPPPPPSPPPPPVPTSFALHELPSPPPSRALESAKLAALHARLSLPPRLPLQTLARCLVDPSADPSPMFNNTALSILGNDLLGYHTAEQILCRYPRLPMVIIFAAMRAYCGPSTLASMTREWGVDAAAEPGGEVDPGLLQFRHRVPGNADLDGMGVLVKDGKVIKQEKPWNKGVSSFTVSENYFGDPAPRPSSQPAEEGVTLERASTNFVRALVGALYLHCGRSVTKSFFMNHFFSRHLDIASMFHFRQPTRDLSRLCAREGLVSPVARILSETGRQSRHPVFVVGVFSGREKLGEGQGGSLDEARFRAALNALKSWYLYSPLEVRVPSEVEDGLGKKWEPVLVDGGEIIV